MMPDPTWPVAVIGSGDVGSDLITKIRRGGGPLTVAATEGVDTCDIRIVFDTSAANADRDNRAELAHAGARVA